MGLRGKELLIQTGKIVAQSGGSFGIFMSIGLNSSQWNEADAGQLGSPGVLLVDLQHGTTMLSQILREWLQQSLLKPVSFTP
ncbi:hypothetical protein ANCCAN_25116 [Ancylostoma caninum]|uniref:Uncharacterized protein n=1 Tax=Ancylostoma caninum TaxID=29170 RepID=A0A368FE31_ANCCA|nr:hypothetical protein ANCCAN_25116 [Ancylostoma caninum]